MDGSRLRRQRSPHQWHRAWLVCLVLLSHAHAFPPAPDYVLYGTVHDQVGQTLDVDGAEIVLLKGGQEIGRAPITHGTQLDQNYELTIRLDMMRAGTSTYSSTAVQALGAFSIVVELNGLQYYPIEATGPLKAGRGGERVRLDLNLGEDSDHDGLPDIWEQWQLYQAGFFPDENGNWPLNLIDRNGDLDHDGLSNWLEYLAGTFAGDAAERFALDIKEKTAGGVRFEFYAITGKKYTIERSMDMTAWSRVGFAVGGAAAAEVFTSPSVGVKSAWAVPTPGAKEFYRLTVR